MAEYDLQYRRTLIEILNSGQDCPDRTGTGVRKIFDVNMNTDASPTEGDRLRLPALTLRKVFPRSAWYELLWMLRGSTDATELQNKRIKIWDGNTSREYLDSIGLNDVETGHGGKIYGYQFRNFNGSVDQVKNVIESIKTNPNGRRHYISLWNPSELGESCLPPCHVSYQFVVMGGTLNLKYYMRSNDFMLGQPMNQMFATFFLQLLASITGYQAGRVAVSIADCHLYHNHLDAARVVAERPPIEHVTSYSPPFSKEMYDEMGLDAMLDSLFFDCSWENVIAPSLDYQSHDKIDPSLLKMAV